MRTKSLIAALAAAGCLTASAAALARASAGKAVGVTYIEAASVSAAFAKGAVLVERGNYMIHASRRDAAGQAEIHAKDTDIIYVLDGSATFVTGGSVPDGRTTAPDEIRGSAIAGGETRTIGKGDVLVVPEGTPHWFKEVPGPLTYYVVKVR